MQNQFYLPRQSEPLHRPISELMGVEGFFLNSMEISELPEHTLEFLAWRAFTKSKQIDCVSIAEEILPKGAHPDYWSAAKRLGTHVLNHMAERRLVWQDEHGFWRESGK